MSPDIKVNNQTKNLSNIYSMMGPGESSFVQHGIINELIKNVLSANKYQSHDQDGR